MRYRKYHFNTRNNKYFLTIELEKTYCSIECNWFRRLVEYRKGILTFLD